MWFPPMTLTVSKKRETSVGITWLSNCWMGQLSSKKNWIRWRLKRKRERRESKERNRKLTSRAWIQPLMRRKRRTRCMRMEKPHTNQTQGIPLAFLVIHRIKDPILINNIFSPPQRQVSIWKEVAWRSRLKKLQFLRRTALRKTCFPSSHKKRSSALTLLLKITSWEGPLKSSTWLKTSPKKAHHHLSQTQRRYWKDWSSQHNLVFPGASSPHSSFLSKVTFSHDSLKSKWNF